jgi:hypothetical protein
MRQAHLDALTPLNVCNTWFVVAIDGAPPPLLRAEVFVACSAL